MNRRQLLQAGGAGVIGSLAGCTQVLSQSSRLEVSIYLPEGLVSEYTITESYHSKLTDALTHSLTSLPSVNTIEVSIITDQEISNPTELTEEYELDLLDSWREEFRSEIDPPTKSKDSNILLLPDSYTPRGRGSIPTQVTQNRDIGYVSNGSELLSSSAFLSVDEEVIPNAAGPFGPLIHEIGHNIGLIHAMGTVVETASSVPIVTPMIGLTYLPNFQGKENYYGTAIPESVSLGDVRLSSTFNTQITESDIHLK